MTSRDEREPAVALVSGGLDSMVAAALVRETGTPILALSVRYGQRHAVELEAAARVAAMLGARRHVVLDLDLSAFGGSALTGDGEVPKDGEGTTGAAGIPVTYVPARNTVFLSLCLAWAEAAGARELVIGVNALDYSGYPDCRPEFAAAFERLAALATRAGVESADERPFRVAAPLQHMTKADIVREGARLALDLGASWSCYDPQTPAGAPGPLHCGLCDSCRLRRRGFEEAGVPDPTGYAATP